MGENSLLRASHCKSFFTAKNEYINIKSLYFNIKEKPDTKPDAQTATDS
jgi:hypothetical protein